MFSNILGTMEGAAIYAVIGLIIFTAFFVGVIIWVVTVDKKYISKMENLPLENENEVLNNTES